MEGWAIVRAAVVSDLRRLDQELWVFEALMREGKYEVYPTPDLIERRSELFVGGHRLYLMGAVDDERRVMSLQDAWFDRGQEL